MAIKRCATWIQVHWQWLDIGYRGVLPMQPLSTVSAAIIEGKP
jgi:hypothetical protein